MRQASHVILLAVLCKFMYMYMPKTVNGRHFHVWKKYFCLGNKSGLRRVVLLTFNNQQNTLAQ